MIYDSNIKERCVRNCVNIGTSHFSTNEIYTFIDNMNIVLFHGNSIF